MDANLCILEITRILAFGVVPSFWPDLRQVTTPDAPIFGSRATESENFALRGLTWVDANASIMASCEHDFMTFHALLLVLRLIVPLNSRALRRMVISERILYHESSDKLASWSKFLFAARRTDSGIVCVQLSLMCQMCQTTQWVSYRLEGTPKRQPSMHVIVWWWPRLQRYVIFLFSFFFFAFWL